ncbi:retrovirus-related pol polyprotein from transposon TNT 1-94 [Tanacetum coccineum]
MSTQQDIYAIGSENRPPMLNKENYVPCSSRLIRHMMNSLRMSLEAEIKQMEADDQAIQTILLGLPEDIYDAVDSCEIAQEIWLRVQKMMKGSDIGIQEKKAKLFNEWERFTSTDGESIESYYHCFSKLMNDFKRNKHFLEKIDSNLKFLNNLQLEWSRHVTIDHQTKDLHTADYTQLYDFLKYNQKEVDDQRAERLAKIHDPLALMANSNNPFNYPVFHQDQPSPSTYMQQPQPINNNYNPQPSFNQNYMQQPVPNPKDIIDPTTAMNMALILMAKTFKLNYSTPTNNNQEFHQILVIGRLLNRNLNGNGNVVAARAEGNAIRNNVRPRRRDAPYLQTKLLIAQKEEAGIQLQAEEFDLMVAAADLDEIKEVNANYGSAESDFKLREDELLDKQIQLENKIKELDNILVKTEADESLAKHKALELEIECLLRAIVKQDIMSIVQSNFVEDTSNLQTELERMKERFKNCINKRENEYAKLWNDWYKKCKECKYDKILYDKAYNDMQQKIERLQAQLGDKKGKSKDTPCVSNTLDLLSWKLENENVELEFQVLNYAKENAHLKTTYKNLLLGKKSMSLPKLEQALGQIQSLSQPHVITKKDVNYDLHGLSSTGVDNTTKTRRPQPRSNTKNDRVPSASKSSCIKNKEAEVIEICLWCIDSGCSKHMTGNLKLLINFVWKFLGTVRFGNDHVAAILGFGDLQWGNILITRVYFVEGLGHNLFSVGQFCDSDLEVAFRRNTCFVRNLEGVDLLKGNHTTNLYTINLHEMASAYLISLWLRAILYQVMNSKNQILKAIFDSVGISLQESLFLRTTQQNGVVERRYRTLVEAARTMLIFSRASLFLWVEAIATACYTQNRSIITRRFNKTPYELINGRKPDISFLHVFGALCYPKNDREDIGKLGAKGDIGFFIGYSADSCAYRVYNRRTKKIIETMNVTFDELSEWF